MKKGFLTYLIMFILVLSSLFCLNGCNFLGEQENSSGHDDSRFENVYNMYVVYAESNGTTPLSYEAWLNSIKGRDGLNGKDGLGVKSILINGTGHLIITYTDNSSFDAGLVKGKDGQDGNDGKNGKDGTDGQDGLTPYIKNGNWWIGETDTEIKAQGFDGKDGTTPTISISQDGFWIINNEKTSIKAVGIDGKDGKDGKNGVDGVDGKNGENGKDGKDGVGVETAYINDKTHLIIVLTDGTEIDSGFVGVETVKTYTVTFKDYDGSVIRAERICENESAVAPNVKDRKGYRFKGWDKEFDCVKGDLEVNAEYEEMHNQIGFDFVDNKDGSVTATMFICGDVKLYGLELNVGMDLTGMEFKKVESCTLGAAANLLNGKVKVSFVNDTGKNLLEERSIIKITFNVTENKYSAELTFSDIDIFDETITTETYSVLESTFNN